MVGVSARQIWGEWHACCKATFSPFVMETWSENVFLLAMIMGASLICDWWKIWIQDFPAQPTTSTRGLVLGNVWLAMLCDKGNRLCNLLCNKVTSYLLMHSLAQHSSGSKHFPSRISIWLGDYLCATFSTALCFRAVALQGKRPSSQAYLPVWCSG